MIESIWSLFAMASLPSSAYCGDTIAFTHGINAASGKVILRHIETGGIISIDPVISSGAWAVTISPIDTAEAEAGQYIVKALADTDGIRETIDLGLVTLLAPIDRPARSTHIRKMVALLEAHLEGRLDDTEGRGLESYTIGGVPITKISITDATNLLDRYKRSLQTEIEKERIALGLSSNRVFHTTFR